MLIEIAIVLLLTVLNGMLALSELAVVSARPARLKVMADGGSRGARIAIDLAEEPGRFLSTVQIGITLVGVLSGAFSGATLGERFSAWLLTRGLSEGTADALGFGIVVATITYLSLIIGELVPKQIALRDPERVASKVAPAMVVLSKLAAPIVWFLDKTGRMVLRLLGQHGEADESVTEEEVRSIIAEAESAGVLEAEEKSMISGVMRLADRSARGLMTPRRDVELLDVGDELSALLAKAGASRRSRLPVRDGSDDSIIGVVAARDLFRAAALGYPVDLKAMVQTVPVVSDNAEAFDVLKAIRGSTAHMALVFDEYGHFEGIVTTGDVLAAIIGAYEAEDEDEPAAVRRDDGSWLIAGWMPVDEFADATGAPVDKDATYKTAAGFMLDGFGHLPKVGESFEDAGWRFEVVDRDGLRIDMILAIPPKTGEG